ncbi:MAG TPA: hypothetical protein VFI29_03225 [Hanamia sp.]|nr:hypothetical protein [Hanamia sp.]
MQHLSNQRKLNLTLCVRLDLNNGGNGGNTLCNGTGVIDASGSGGLKQSQQITSTTFTDYIFNYYSLASFEPYLVIAAIPQIGISSQTILIRKITIEETPPPVSFTLPVSLSFQCGSTTPQTFAVTNVYGTTGITNYTWNLGSATNGWLFNGNPAPQAISTGTTNTLTLTPVCGASQNNISATVTANGNNYATNSSIVSLTPPSITISGNSSLCSGTSTYSVSNVPCNGTVTWSASPSGIISLSPNGSSVSVTKVGNGGVTLTAKINACSNYSVHMAIAVGTPEQSYGIYPVDYPSSYCTGENYSYGFEALGASGDPSGYEWIDYGPSQTHYYYNQGDQIQLSFTESGTHTIAIIASVMSNR